MKLTRVPFSEVALDLQRPQPIDFNNSFHTKEEAPDLDEPSEAPYAFKRWLSLILKSRGLDSSDVQVITLSRAQTRVLHEAMDASAQLDHINRLYREDLDDVVRPALAGISFPPEGLFVRLDACSPKDGAQLVPGRRAIRLVDELLLRIVTSGRARSAVRKILEDDQSDGMQLFLMPFDDRMASAREYRVFCPPEAEHISAISQYQWHQPWRFAERTATQQEEVVQQIWEGCKDLHAAILEELSDADEMDRMLRRQGFSFDVLYDDENGGRCELVELNGFGARSSCGSCLFQWIRDCEELYNGTETVFRVTW